MNENFIPEEIVYLIKKYSSTRKILNVISEPSLQWIEHNNTTLYICRWFIEHNFDSIDSIKCFHCGVAVSFNKGNQYRLKNINPQYCFCSAKCAANNETKKNKIASTNLKKYGCASVLQNSSICERKTQTMINRYGDNYGKTIRAKGSKTNLEKYGVTSAFWAEQYHVSNLQKYRSKFYDSFVKLLDDRNILLLDTKEQYCGGITEFHYMCKNCGRVWTDNNHDAYHMRVCHCYSKHSVYETQLYQYVQTIYDGVLEQHNRSLLGRKELDLYLPDARVAIEFNGVYWHSIDHVIDRLYHQDKSLGCSAQGVCLYHVYEDEWVCNREEVKQKIKNLINHNVEFTSKISLDYNIAPLFPQYVIANITEPQRWFVYQNKRYRTNDIIVDKAYSMLYDSGCCTLKEK